MIQQRFNNSQLVWLIDSVRTYYEYLRCEICGNIFYETDCGEYYHLLPFPRSFSEQQSTSPSNYTKPAIV